MSEDRYTLTIKGISEKEIRDIIDNIYGSAIIANGKAYPSNDTVITISRKKDNKPVDFF